MDRRDPRQSAEALRHNSETLRNNPNHGIFFAGVHGGYPDLRGIQRTFNKTLGSGTVYNSAFLAEAPEPDRYQNMAKNIKQQLKDGKNLVIFGHSYGAVEAVRAVYEDPEVREKYSKNIKMIFISPVDFVRTPFGAIKGMVKYGRVLVQESRLLGRSVWGKTSTVGGVVSASTMPSDVISRESAMQAARLGARRLSHRSAQEVDFVANRPYFSMVDEKIQDRVREIDRRLDAARERGSRWGVRRELRRRGRDTKDIVAEIFKGKFANDFGDPPQQAQPPGKRRGSWALRSHLVMDAFMGRDLKKLRELQDSGIEMWVGIPEFDLMNSVKSATRILRGDSSRVFTVPFSTHGAPWGVQSDILAPIMEHCGVILKTPWNSRNAQASI